MFAQIQNQPTWTEVLRMPPEVQPLLAVVLGGLAVGLVLTVRLQAGEPAGAARRKLALGACAQAAGVACWLVETLLGLATSSWVIPAHSLLQLIAVGLVLWGLYGLSQQRLLSTGGVTWLACLAAGAVFWGVTAGESTLPLLQSNLAAVFCHGSFFALTNAVLMRMTLTRFRQQRRELRARIELQDQVNRKLETEAEEALELAAAKMRFHAEQKEETARLRRRAGALEQILAVTARINGTRNMSDLLDQVAGAARDILGFRMVLVRLFSRSTQAFEARAFAGVPEEGKAYLSGMQVSLEEYRKMTLPRFRISDSYFINHLDEDSAEAMKGGYVADLGQRSQGEWHEDDALIVPLTSPAEEPLGYLSLDDPEDRRIPALAVIRQAEFLARQAATAIESAQIYDHLAKKNSELSQASEMLTGFSEMKNNFVANVSHELRTPLTSISAYAEMLRENAQGMSTEVRNEFLKVITKESTKLTGIIDDILDLSRMEEKQGSVVRLETDLVTLVRRLEESLAAKSTEQEIDFTVDMTAEEILLDVDPVLVQQLLDHLLGNAFKFTPAGGQIRLAVADRGNEVHISVQDSGIGIPEEKMRYIFDRFYQVDGSSTREHGGQGVGLALCQDIVSFHDGLIWVEKVEPSGARFRVVLPRRERVVQGIPSQLPVLAKDDPTEFVRRLMDWIAETCRVKMVSLLVPDPQQRYLQIKAAIGLPESVVQSTRIRKGAGIAGKVWASGRSLWVPDVTADRRLGKGASDPKYSTPSLLSVPLLDGLDVIGVVNVNNRRDGNLFDENDRILLEALAPRISFLLKQLQNHEFEARRFADVKEAMRSAVSLQQNRYNGISAVCHEICLATARRIKLPPEEMEHLALALRYYDVGMSRVSGQLLRKTAPLSREERNQIQNHVAASLAIMDPLQIPSKVRQVIHHHHERVDGTGYPDGLEGEAIPIGARLVILADSLNAMLHDRPYRPRLSVAEAVAEIENQTGTQFCSRLARQFLAELAPRQTALKSFQAGLASSSAPPPTPRPGQVQV